MFTEQEVIGLQAEHHPLVPTEVFADLEEYCLHLLHQKAYEEAAQLAQQKVVLDMGCNNGYGTHVISTKARRVVGVDVSHRAIEAARRAYGRPGVEFLAIDGRGLPFADHNF